MRLLLDTHIAIWAVLDSPKLPARARRLIKDSANEISVSVVSLWEIGIKHRLKRSGKKMAMPVSAMEARDHFIASGYGLLVITANHAIAFEDLPRHTADPFDRMLVAQALSEPMRLVTHDEDLIAYGALIEAV